ncbi:MAG: hypothetical protein ABIY51_01915 [Ferruginibacter sp.]
MMIYYLIVGLSYVIAIAAGIGLWKLRQADESYYPIIVLACVATLNELLSTILSYTIHSTVVNNNIYVLVEAVIIVWQFSRWKLFGGRNKVYVIITFAMVALWIIERIYLTKASDLSILCRIIFSFIIVFMSMVMCSKVILEYSNNLWKQSSFLICVGFCVFFSYKIITETLWLYGIEKSDSLLMELIYIMTVINLLVNVLFCLAILWIPEKPRYIMSS